MYCPFLSSWSSEGAGSHWSHSLGLVLWDPAGLGQGAHASGVFVVSWLPLLPLYSPTLAPVILLQKSLPALACKGALLFLDFSLQEQLWVLRKNEPFWKNKTGSFMEKYCDSQSDGCGSRSIFLAKRNNSNLNIKRGLSWWDTKM